MRKSILLLATIVVLAAAANAAEEFVADELLVSFQPGIRGARADGIRNGLGASRMKAWPEINAEHWHLPPGLGVAQAIQALASNPNVVYAEPNYIIQAFDVPNDPLFNQLYALHSIGQTGGTIDVDIDALEAWQLPYGNAAVVVGIIDSGVDYYHPDLADKIWSNTGEIPGNGIDDDHNGYRDDIRGWDFANNDDDPMDDLGHGTHVSGTIAAEGNNGVGVIGVAGMNPIVKLMPLKFLAANGYGTTANAVNCITYAASFTDGLGNHTVRLTSNSWGGGGKSKTLETAINNCGALVVASAGNDGTNTIQYPAGYSSANIISVAATDDKDQLASFSNFSGTWVDLAAPGVNILSTTPGNSYDSWNGTSMAAPHVSGVAALLMSQAPSLSVDAIKAQILGTVDLVPGLAGKTLTGGRLNARNALGAPELAPDTTAPAAVTDLAATATTSPNSESPISVTLTWTAPGDDGWTGRAYIYDARFSINPINNDDDFFAAAKAQAEPAPQAAGTTETFTIENLLDLRTYYFAVKTIDAAGNISALSNLPSIPTPQADWHYIRVGAAQNVGNYVSSSATSIGTWSVVWDDKAAGLLRAAVYPGGGSYNVQTVASGGIGCSVAYNPGENEISASHVSGTLLYFATRGTNSGSTWTSTQVDKDTYPGDTCLVFGQTGPMISYYRTTRRSTGLCLARRTGSVWSNQLIDSGATVLYNQLAIDPAGNPVIAYSVDANNDGKVDTLKFARYNGTAWNIAVIEAGGAYPTVAIDTTTGSAAVAHYNSVTRELRFLRSNGSTWTGAEIVETAPSITGCSLAFRSDGTAYLAYGAANMRVAIRDTYGTWTFREIDTSTTGGIRNSLRGRPNLTPSSVAYRGPAWTGAASSVLLAISQVPY